ncbi:TetR/AcrR family transcriptional regulator [Subtercola sp. RTI3]|nr:TetR/AcrR family transcriptional regulator [Subtercola sp. RTI3]
MLDLASARPANEVLASEVASYAGVNRSTFYDHAASPTALLEAVLREQLDALRELHLSGADPQHAGAAIAAVTRAVLLHVEEHSAVYLLGLSETSGSASLHPMLTAHFEASIRLLLEQHTIVIADHYENSAPGAQPNPRDDGLLSQMATRMIADGSVGAITAWLRSPQPHDVDAFLGAYRQLLPEWFPLVA